MLKLLDDSLRMDAFIEAWNRAIDAFRSTCRTVTELLRSLYEAATRELRTRESNRAHWRMELVLGSIVSDAPFAYNHAAAMRFHVAATGD